MDSFKNTKVGRTIYDGGGTILILRHKNKQTLSTPPWTLTGVERVCLISTPYWFKDQSCMSNPHPKRKKKKKKPIHSKKTGLISHSHVYIHCLSDCWVGLGHVWIILTYHAVLCFVDSLRWLFGEPPFDVVVIMSSFILILAHIYYYVERRLCVMYWLNGKWAKLSREATVSFYPLAQWSCGGDIGYVRMYIASIYM